MRLLFKIDCQLFMCILRNVYSLFFNLGLISFVWQSHLYTNNTMWGKNHLNVAVYLVQSLFYILHTRVVCIRCYRSAEIRVTFYKHLVLAVNEHILIPKIWTDLYNNVVYLPRFWIFCWYSLPWYTGFLLFKSILS